VKIKATGAISDFIFKVMPKNKKILQCHRQNSKPIAVCSKSVSGESADLLVALRKNGIEKIKNVIGV
jgi:hypothetical protein